VVLKERKKLKLELLSRYYTHFIFDDAKDTPYISKIMFQAKMPGNKIQKKLYPFI
jgi:hypothetical protein